MANRTEQVFLQEDLRASIYGPQIGLILNIGSRSSLQNLVRTDTEPEFAQKVCALRLVELAVFKSAPIIIMCATWYMQILAQCSTYQ